MTRARRLRMTGVASLLDLRGRRERALLQRVPLPEPFRPFRDLLRLVARVADLEHGLMRLRQPVADRGEKIELGFEVLRGGRALRMRPDLRRLGERPALDRE